MAANTDFVTLNIKYAGTENVLMLENCCTTSTIEDIKKRIIERIDNNDVSSSLDHIRLIYGGRILCDNSVTLLDILRFDNVESTQAHCLHMIKSPMLQLSSPPSAASTGVASGAVPSDHHPNAATVHVPGVYQFPYVTHYAGVTPAHGFYQQFYYRNPYTIEADGRIPVVIYPQHVAQLPMQHPSFYAVGTGNAVGITRGQAVGHVQQQQPAREPPAVAPAPAAAAAAAGPNSNRVRITRLATVLWLFAKYCVLIMVFATHASHMRMCVLSSIMAVIFLTQIGILQPREWLNSFRSFLFGSRNVANVNRRNGQRRDNEQRGSSEAVDEQSTSDENVDNEAIEIPPPSLTQEVVAFIIGLFTSLMPGNLTNEVHPNANRRPHRIHPDYIAAEQQQHQ